MGQHLRVGALREDGADRRVVAGKAVDLKLGPHVPDAAGGIAAACEGKRSERDLGFRVS